ncbi:MAG: hypothetical protein BM562_06980 [Alphaproteobacteria bacterium MedPE-SWcel]|nr:MAG: hypothetical protein BM562_06980 [Alphaproteobacteria bacterium MedPE-SWcel]
MNTIIPRWQEQEPASAPLSMLAFEDRMSRLARVQGVSGGQIRYALAGEGPETILFLHGIPLSMQTWQDLFFRLARGYRVLAIDMPGFGQSGKAFEDYSLDATSARVAELCRALGIGRLHVAGSSFGAAVASVLALNEPELVDRLMLINSVGIAGGTHAVERAARIGLVRQIMRSALLRENIGIRIFRAKMQASYAAHEPDDAMVTYYYRQLLEPGATDSFLMTLRQFRERDLQARLPDLRKPVLSIWGTQDKVLPVKKSVGIQTRLGDCWSVVLPGAGHLPHEEFPDRCASLFHRFLSLDDTRA